MRKMASRKVFPSLLPRNLFSDISVKMMTNLKVHVSSAKTFPIKWHNKLAKLYKKTTTNKLETAKIYNF